METSSLHRSWGARIKARRQVIGMTQERLASIVQVQQATISKIEAGVLVPRDDLKWKLAGALVVTLEDLFPYPAVVPPYPAEEIVA